MSRLVLAIAALGASACGVPLDGLQPQTLNQCESSSDCGSGATCAAIGENSSSRLCVATEADIGGLVLEVRPPSQSATKGGDPLAGTSFLIEPGVSLSGTVESGHAARFDAQLPQFAVAKGVVLYGGSVPGYEFFCRAPDSSIPADLLFRRAAPHVGLPAAEHVASTEIVLDRDGVPASFEFTAELPPGTYDIYVTPSGPDCVDAMEQPVAPPPPHFAGRHALQGAQTLSISLPQTKRLSGTIEVKSTFDIDGWELAVLEPYSGLEISTVQQIIQPDLISATNIDVLFHFPLLPQGDDKQGPIIRLRPQAPSTSPSLYWDLLTADFGNDLNVTLTPGALDDAETQLDVQVLGADGEAVVSSVILQATSVDGDQNNVSFQVISETDEDGWFHVEVFDGEYEVFARPKIDGPDAIGHALIDSVANGSSIELQKKTHLTATVSAPNGELLFGAEASAGPSVPKLVQPSSYLKNALAAAPVEPRPDAASIESGQLALLLDPGTYDVSVKPAPGSGYPWLVLPRLTILDDQTVSDVGPLDIGFPVVLYGVLRDAGGEPVPRATIRAWIPIGVDPDAGEAGTVVQIAETTTLDDGSYILALPASVSD